MKAHEFDDLFDKGHNDIMDQLDLSTVSRPGLEQKRVNVDFPAWMNRQLDREAARLGIPRQSLIKVWIAERLKQESA